MKVKGHEVTDAQHSAMIDAMSAVEQFRASDIEAVAVSAGVPEGSIANRVVDRMIQAQRKKGWITLVNRGPYWTTR